MIHDLIIIGSGPAGLTAAIYAARADLKPLVITGHEPGGQLMQTTEVENYPGFVDGIMGPELMTNMRKQAERFGAVMIDSQVTGVDLKTETKTVKTREHVYQTKSVIIATGASTKWLGLESETKFKGRGVSSCATCDGAFFRNKKIYVLGGGDTAMEEATFLTKFTTDITIIHRSDQFRASPIMLAKAQNNPAIKWLTDTVVEEFIGDQKLTTIKVRNTGTEKTEELPADGVFVAIGHTPNTKLFNGQLAIDDKGYLITHQETQTNIPGVFVAGDVYDHRYRQAVTAASSGCKASLDVLRYLED